VSIDDEITAHYELGQEKDRLTGGRGRLEALRTRELLARWLPPAPAVVLDVGGAAGIHALPLARQGYRVHLLDPVPLHIEQARQLDTGTLRSAEVGDARMLPYADAGADAVLLLGPLYHLTERADRLAALREARRVLRPGGVVVAAGISRWASTFDLVDGGLLSDAWFADVVAHDVATGIHLNPGRRAGFFSTAYFHRPEDLVAEVAEAGLEPDGPVAVEGVGGFAPDIDAVLDDDVLRERLLAAVRATEREPALLGASSHLLVAGTVPGN
jgi:SAM-dependent methyltransferase